MILLNYIFKALIVEAKAHSSAFWALKFGFNAGANWKDLTRYHEVPFTGLLIQSAWKMAWTLGHFMLSWTVICLRVSDLLF